MKKTIIAAMSFAAIVFAPSGASAQVCIVGIFAAAAQANLQDNRELTAKEAWTCGLTYWFETPKPEPKKVSRRHKRH
ncbi:MAG: hypothetical protein ACREQD_10930 [Candidatus Binataceae bacterium]